MLNAKDREQYFEVLMALNGFNGMADKDPEAMPKGSRRAIINDNFSFYGSRTGTFPESMQFHRK